MSNIPKITTFLFLSLFCLMFHGCVKDTAELEKKILVQDPSFQKALDNRNALRKEIRTPRTTYLREKRTIDSQIAALKEKKAAAGKEYSSSLERIKRQIHPMRRQLERDLLDMQRQYGRKKQAIRDIDRDINEINSLIKKKDDLDLTQEEVRTWNERLSALIEKKEALNLSAEQLQTSIETAKMKLDVLEL